MYDKYVCKYIKRRHFWYELQSWHQKAKSCRMKYVFLVKWVNNEHTEWSHPKWFMLILTLIWNANTSWSCLNSSRDSVRQSIPTSSATTEIYGLNSSYSERILSTASYYRWLSNHNSRHLHRVLNVEFWTWASALRDHCLLINAITIVELALVLGGYTNIDGNMKFYLTIYIYE
jgi:hypothetical protein